MPDTLSPIDFISQNFDSEARHDYVQSSTDLLTYSDFTSFRRDIIEKDKIKHSVDFCYYEQNNTYSVPVQTLVKYYSSFSLKKDPYHFNQDSINLMIPGVRYLSPGVVVFERPPSYQHVSASFASRDGIDEETEEHSYYLPIPWQVYIATYNTETMRLIDTRMYFAENTLYAPSQPLYAPPLLNFYSNGKLCRPFYGSMEDVEKYDKTISGVIAAAFDSVWNSGFNLDITENISQFLIKKKYDQFFEYIKDPKLTKYCNYLINNQISSIPYSLPHGFLKSFFKCWEQVPLEKISNISWSTFTKADFFYREELDQQDISIHVDSYLATHDICVHEYDDDHYDDYGDISCPDNCISEEDLYNSHSFRTYIQNQTSLLPDKKRPLSEAVQQVVNELHSYRQAARSSTLFSFRKMFFDHSHILSNPS